MLFDLHGSIDLDPGIPTWPAASRSKLDKPHVRYTRGYTRAPRAGQGARVPVRRHGATGSSAIAYYLSNTQLSHDG